MGAHRFPSLEPLIYALYAASLVDSAKLRVPHPALPAPRCLYRYARLPLKAFVGNLPSLGRANFLIQRDVDGGLERLEPEKLAAHPNSKRNQVCRVYNTAASESFGSKQVWSRTLDPR